MSIKVLVIGGERHGEWVEGVLEGARMWVDIQNAARHVIRKMTSGITAPDGTVIEAYVIYAAVHEQLMGPDEPNIVSSLLQALAMNEFARAHGEAQEIPKEPAGSSLVVPGGPS